MYKPKCDIYGMAVVLWEMVIRIIKGQYSRPFSEYQNLKFDFQVISRLFPKIITDYNSRL